MTLYRIYELRYIRDMRGNECDASLPCKLHFYKEENARNYCIEHSGYVYREEYILIGDTNEEDSL